jgi:hypothetical protein
MDPIWTLEACEEWEVGAVGAVDKCGYYALSTGIKQLKALPHFVT